MVESPRDMLLRLRFSVGLGMAVVVVGTVGYRLIEGWSWLESFWMVMITLTTIGFGEIHPLSDLGRMFTLLLIGGGLSIATYVATSVTRQLVEGDLLHAIRRERKRRELAMLKDHYIVAGCGRLGLEIIEELLHAGQRVVAVDPNPESEPTIRHARLTFLRGDGAHDSVLSEAGLERARGLAVATASDAVNVLITLSARQMRPEMPIATRVSESEMEDKARKAGATSVLNPFLAGGARMANNLLRPHTYGFLDLALSRKYTDLSIEDIRLRPNTSLIGPLADLKLRERFGVTAIAVTREDGKMLPVPTADTRIGPGDIIIVVGRPEQIDAFVKVAGVERGQGA